MTTQGILVDSVFAGLTGSTGNFVNKRLAGGRVAFHPAGGANTYKNIYTSATVGGSTLIDQSVNSGVVLNEAGSAEVYAVGHYLCKAYDSDNVLQITFELRYGDVTSDGSGGSAAATSILDIKSSYGTNAADINNAITYANANSASHFVFLFKDANFTLENNMAFPANVTMQVEPTAKLMLYAGVNSVTINGPIKHDFNQIFKHENNTTCTVTIDPKYTEQVYPQWFGAVPDGTSDSSFFVTKALATGIKRLVLAGGNFKLNSNITIPSNVEIIRKGGSDFTLASGVTVSGLGTKATVFDKVSATSILGPVTGNVTGNLTGSLTTGSTERLKIESDGKVKMFNDGVGIFPSGATNEDSYSLSFYHDAASHDSPGDGNLPLGGTNIGFNVENADGSYWKYAKIETSSLFDEGEMGLYVKDDSDEWTGLKIQDDMATFYSNAKIYSDGKITTPGDIVVDTNTFKVDTTNNRVGIGTATPSTTLDVNGDLTVDTTTLKVDSTNNRIGIGTATPTQTLDVRGAIQTRASVPDIYVDSTVTNTFRGLFLKENDTNKSGIIQYGSTHSSEANNLAIKNYVSSGDIKFYTNNTNRMNIHDSGSIYINRSVAGVGPGFVFTSTGASYQYKDGTYTSYMMLFYRGLPSSTTLVGGITTTGTSTSYNTSSDYRLKENVKPIKDGLSRLMKLKPNKFNFISDKDTVVDGFIAHETQEVVPEAVTNQKDDIDEEGNPKYQGIDQGKLVPLLVAAVQELSKKVTAQEKIIKTLQKKVN